MCMCKVSLPYQLKQASRQHKARQHEVSVDSKEAIDEYRGALLRESSIPGMKAGGVNKGVNNNE